jgi:hypothetical protein
MRRSCYTVRCLQIGRSLYLRGEHRLAEPCYPVEIWVHFLMEWLEA